MSPLSKLHKHPDFTNETTNVAGKKTYVYGYLLEPGDELEKGDVYASSSGGWVPAPIIGIKLTKTTVIWVRPS